MAARDGVSLSDRYDLSKHRVLLSGTQALVRLMLMQKARDAAAGLDTAGYVSGYRGSPLGTVDQQFAVAASVISAHRIRFEPGLNEELAATALWGTQQAEMRGEGRHDGVFGMWYGKGPGVDRCGDVFRHANAAGTSRHGGVLVLMGDDHGAESSTVAHQSEFALIDVMSPILHPAGVQEILDFGLLGIALSRYCGLWVGLKCVHDNVESTAVVDAPPGRPTVVLPDFDMPQGGLNIRPGDDRLEQERRLHRYKHQAAAAFARANGIDRVVFSGGRQPRIGIVATGKSYLDTIEALGLLGIGEREAGRIGIRLLKIGMVFPLQRDIVREFAGGLDLVMVVEEKRALVESQLREALYGIDGAPAIIGKCDEEGAELFGAHGTLEANQIALALARRLGENARGRDLAARVGLIETARREAAQLPQIAVRVPYFCAGCPHNRSTIVPEGGRAYGGIGCHYLAQFIPGRRTEGSAQMGGDGANWIGEAPFSTREHIFQNMGDGTYTHSGSLTVRAAIAAGVTMTYKILYNDAVAMTGGQALEGGMSVPMIARQMAAEGVARIAIVTDEVDKYPADADFPPFTAIHHRDELDGVQRELMAQPGVSVLIYDQTCAAEKRRRRKRGTFPDPARRVFINERVCEGCGDCGVQSNCVAIQPAQTPWGRKRQIDQAVCNKDFSCLKGFCPSFVTIEGGQLRKPERAGSPAHAGDGVPDIVPPQNGRATAIVITGIGGTGVVTVGAVLAMAAHIDGKAAGVIDMTGLAQKNGAVVTHMRIADDPADISAIRIAAGGADVLLGCDLVTSASPAVLGLLAPGRSRAVVNGHEVVPALFTQERDYELPGPRLRAAIVARARPGQAGFTDATALAGALCGEPIAANMFILGFAWQQGLIALSRQAIEQAIALNGVAVQANLDAFAWGRHAAHDAAAVARIAGVVGGGDGARGGAGESLDEEIERRAAFLDGYQNRAWADRYRARLGAVRRAEGRIGADDGPLSRAAARSLFALMSCKDEYEVARLYSDGVFAAELARVFSGPYKISLHLAPPILGGGLDPATGRPRKRAFGGWILAVFRVLARARGLRGSWADPFARSAERRAERRLIGDYDRLLDEITGALTPQNHGLAAELAALPETIRGFGPVKMQAIADFEAAREKLLARWRGEAAAREAAQ